MIKACKVIILIIFTLTVYAGCSGSAPVPKENIISDEDIQAVQSITTAQVQATPEPTPEPISTADPLSTKITQTINNMSIEEKIGQLFILRLGSGVYEMNDEIVGMLSKYRPSGIILFSENIKTSDQVLDLVKSLQSESVIPLFISIDEEGGSVSRINSLYEGDKRSSYALARDGGSDAVYKRGRAIGKKLKELGINMNFAPVADVWSNTDNTVIGERSYSNDPETVGLMVSSFIAGLSDEDVLSVIKHFPGHGDTAEDSHVGMAVSRRDLNRLREFELVPFQSGMHAGAIGVMIGHISIPEVTGNDEPAVFSKILLKDILREEMRFDGLIITDAMEMKAITSFYDSGTAAVKAIQAGVDIILIPGNMDDAYNGIRRACDNGEITEERLNQSLERILKVKYGS